MRPCAWYGARWRSRIACGTSWREYGSRPPRFTATTHPWSSVPALPAPARPRLPPPLRAWSCLPVLMVFSSILALPLPLPLDNSAVQCYNTTSTNVLLCRLRLDTPGPRSTWSPGPQSPALNPGGGGRFVNSPSHLATEARPWTTTTTRISPNTTLPCSAPAPAISRRGDSRPRLSHHHRPPRARRPRLFRRRSAASRPPPPPPRHRRQPTLRRVPARHAPLRGHCRPPRPRHRRRPHPRRQVRDARGHAHARGLPAPLPPLAGRPRRLPVDHRGTEKGRRPASRGLCAIALLGVWNWRGTNAAGGKTMLADFDLIAWNGRAVRIVFDSDLMTKQPRPPGPGPADHLAAAPQGPGHRRLPPRRPRRRQAGRRRLFWPPGITTRQLEALPRRPAPSPGRPRPWSSCWTARPPALARPLALLDGHAYAATWLPCRVTLVESASPRGQIVRHDPPLQRVETRLFVIAQDGRLYGEGGDLPLDRLGIDLKLTEVPPPDATWSAKAINRYRRGDRPARRRGLCPAGRGGGPLYRL